MSDLDIDRLEFKVYSFKGLIIIRVLTKHPTSEQLKNSFDYLSNFFRDRKNKKIIFNLSKVQNLLKNNSVLSIMLLGAIFVYANMVKKLALVLGDSKEEICSCWYSIEGFNYKNFGAFETEKEALESFENSHARV